MPNFRRPAYLISGLLLMTLSAAAQQTVSFPTPDGATISADQYGNGDRGVVLAHGGRFDKGSWKKQAEALADAGFRSVAIDFRSEPLGHVDVLAAVHYLRGTGVKTVSVIGGSMGGDYAAEAAEAEPEAIDRLVLLASGAYTTLTHAKARKLFILARDDRNSDGPRLPAIRAQYEKAREPKKLVLLEGSAHAQFLFGTDQAERLMSEIMQFLTAP